MPNKLEYCGGRHNEDLFERGINNSADPFLFSLLKEFQTLYPYLKLIAESNNISDVFDFRVVEAYWIGNELLEKTNMRKFYWHFIDNLNLKKKLRQDEFEKLIGKIPSGAIPHHSFHVFNVWLRTGNLPIAHTIETMNACRISWGKIIGINGNEMEVETQNLIEKENKISLSDSITKKIIYKFFDRGFIENPKINDFVSIHWNFACDILTTQQVKNLEKFTQYSMNLANRQSLTK